MSDHDTPISQDSVSLNFIKNICDQYGPQHIVPEEYYEKYAVKRGLRNADGTGVMTGITRIGDVRGYKYEDGKKLPAPGQLIYRGYDINDLIADFISKRRFGYEETAYLLLFGSLPDREQLKVFTELLSRFRALPKHFTEDMILKAPSRDLMNKLARSTLALYSYDENPEDKSLENELLKAIQLIARYPVIVAHAFACKRHYFDNESLYLHIPQENLSVAENFLYSVRHDNKYSEAEARLLDLCLVLHMEHGGGNNSAFTCRVLSSTGTDIYSSISAAVGSLKGPKHGGANKKVMEMFDHIEANVSDWKDDAAIEAYLEKLLRKQAGDRSGLIYGMGHAIYTMSDPRAVLLKQFARQVAEEKGMVDELELIESVERLTPGVFRRVTGQDKALCANVDLYSGFVYKMMDIPPELYTPLFAIARIVGWCAHRVEEVYNPSGRIIRPAYRALCPEQTFVPLDER